MSELAAPPSSASLSSGAGRALGALSRRIWSAGRGALLAHYPPETTIGSPPVERRMLQSAMGAAGWEQRSRLGTAAVLPTQSSDTRKGAAIAERWSHSSFENRAYRGRKPPRENTFLNLPSPLPPHPSPFLPNDHQQGKVRKLAAENAPKPF